MVTGAVTEDEKVTQWRKEVLVRAGFNDAQATYLAERHHIDLHLAVDLVGLGCTPDIAVDILT